MDYLSHNISENLKRIRHSRGMSLDVMANQTGVSKSMLAQIEKGNANPSIGVLGKITAGLRVTFQELLQEPPLDNCLIRVSEITPSKESEGQYKVWTCFPYEENQKIEIFRIDIMPGGVYESGGHGEKTREYICVMRGELTMELSSGTYQVKENDVFRFESSQSHSYRNNTDQMVCLSCFFM